MARTRKDSVAGKRLQLAEGRAALEPVQPLEDAAKYYFELYTSTRPSFEWSRGDLIRLTQLSQRMAEIDYITGQIKAEGLTVINQRGTPVVNPLVSARDQLERTAIAMEKSLSIYAPVSGGAKANMFEQNKEIDRLEKKKGSDLLA